GEHGLASEPHAQNVLVRIGDDGTLRPDFLHRDLGGFTPHLEKRAELGFHDDALPVFDKLDYDYFQDTAAERLDSLVPYFGRRFLISIQELLPEWRANGWVAPAEPNAPTLGVGLSEEMKGASRRASRRGQRARR
ncbi:MAG: hypothetical protein KC417_05355, partial [Myxococcales bacterium]|nr:hypothetical protein [Myxococcales bacterium]